MTRVALEHVLRAAAALTNESDFIVIGSQCILGQSPDAPPELLVSDEVDTGASSMAVATTKASTAWALESHE